MAIRQSASGEPKVALVVAMDQRRAIGANGDLPWHLPDDLRHFKQLTTGHPILMGRRTFASIGRALPRRRNLVLSRTPQAPLPGVEWVSSFEQALALCRGSEWLMVIGGGEIYHLALPHAQRIHLCQVEAEIADADTWFPDYDPAQWREVARAVHPQDEDHRYRYAQILLERKSSPSLIKARGPGRSHLGGNSFTT